MRVFSRTLMAKTHLVGCPPTSDQIPLAAATIYITENIIIPLIPSAAFIVAFRRLWLPRTSREKTVHIRGVRGQAGQMLHPECPEAEPKNAFVVIQLG